MGQDSKIEWTDDTWNPWRGCTKISPGCAHCYAETLVTSRMGGEKYRKGIPRVRHADATFNAPLRWNKKPWACDTCGECYAEMPFACCGTAEYHRRRVFSLSLGDWLDDEVPIEWLADMLDVIRRCPNLDFLLLTKRPENFKERINEVIRQSHDDLASWVAGWVEGFPVKNVWIGVSVENNEQRIRIGRVKAIPAAVHFLSIEPLLEPLPTLGLQGIDWVIVGGESGPDARPCDVNWIRSVVAQCKQASVPCFTKQLGARPYSSPEHDYATGYEWTLKDHKGGDMAEWPEELQVRQFPSHQPA